MPKPRKRRQPRAPFVVTLSAVSAAAFATLPGCGTVVVNPPDPSERETKPEARPERDECPADPTQPPGDTRCTPGQECAYEEDYCGNPFVARCTSDGYWSYPAMDYACNPPFPTCPAEKPPQGEPCDPALEGTECTYRVENDCGTFEEAAMCQGGTWSVTISSCNPPPPAYCATLTADECAAQPSLCRWLTPGCGEPALPAEGCFPIADCATDDECQSGSCSEVVIDPCAGKRCDACAQTVKVCTAP